MSDHTAGHGGGHLNVGGYVQVAAILTTITLTELAMIIQPIKLYMRANLVWALPLVVPTLLVLSALKFLIVVGFYMHLRFDANYYRAVFGGPLCVGLLMVLVLMLLYGSSLFA